jgi:sugar lactone lactonase YvrE
MGRRGIAAASFLVATALLVLTPSTQCATAAFPGKAGKLAFERVFAGNKFEIFIGSADGRTAVRVRVPLRVPGAPIWSSDGKRLLVTAVSRNGRTTGIYTAKANGSGLKLIGAWRVIRKIRGAGRFTWDAQSKHIYWTVSSSSGSFKIQSATLAGKELHTIVRLKTSDSDSDTCCVAVSPNGRWVAYVTGNPPGTNDACPDPVLFPSYGLYVVSAKGGRSRLVATNVLPDNPDWSPDGSRLVYTGMRPDPQDPQTECLQGLYTVGANRSGERVVFERIPSPRFAPIGDNPTHPVFSPDGRRIAFQADFYKELTDGEAARKEIFIVNADGTGIHALTDPFVREPPSQDYNPNWQPLHG